MRTHTNVLIVPALIVAGLLAACNDPGTRPGLKPAVELMTTPEIAGPASIAPGQSVQLVANVRMADGSLKTVVGSVLWSSSDASVLQVTSTGMATGRQTRGEAVVRADVVVGSITRVAQRPLLVMPEGTFRVVGNVREDDPAGLAVPGARVELTSGEVTTTTSASGQYKLYGVPASADIRVSMAGYETQTRHVALSANATENFLLPLTDPRPNLPGNYRLTIDANSGCPDNPAIPAALQHRSYDATVTQAGPTLNVTLTEPRFRLKKLGIGDRFSGQIFGNTATFSLSSYDIYYYFYYGSYPHVVEAIPGGTYLVVYGNAVTSLSASGLSGTIAGGLVQFNDRFGTFFGQVLGSCTGTLQFALIPR